MLSASWANQSSVLPVMQRRGDARMEARTERAGLKGAVLAAGVLLLGLGPARANEPPRFEQLTAANVTRILQQAVVAARASSTPAYDRRGRPRRQRAGGLCHERCRRPASQVKAGRRCGPPRGLVGFPIPVQAACWPRRSPRRSPAPISPPAATPSRPAPRARSSRSITIPPSARARRRAAVRRAVQPAALLGPFGPLRHQRSGQSRRGRPDHRAEALAARPRRPIPAACRSTRTGSWSAASA